MKIRCVDGTYCTRTRAVLGVDVAADEEIAITLGEVRAVYEGCWWDRAQAFARLGSGGARLSSRQRLVTRDDPALGRHLRRIAAAVSPAVVATLRAELGRCVPRRVLFEVAKVQGAAAQLRRAAEVI